MTASALSYRFELPQERIASVPPEERGLQRDEVRLLVAGPEGFSDTSFRSLAAHLYAGDLVVVNTSPTMPAALSGTMRGDRVGIHLSTLGDDGRWVVELRHSDNSGPIRSGIRSEVIRVSPGGSVRLIHPADGGAPGDVRLWRADVDVPGGVRRFVARHGRPIRYGYVPGAWPLDMYQTIFADSTAWPGSAEMPSAARPFSPRVVASLRRRGVKLATVRLDTGVSSQEAAEPPYPEHFSVSETTATAVNQARLSGSRVVAVGTTVARALESVVDGQGSVAAGEGWTDLVLGPERPLRVVKGLITGFHPPEASHLRLLEAVAGRDVVAAAYDLALDSGYLWHEFGDSCLLIPDGGCSGFSRAA